MDALERAWREDENPAWREHVTPIFYRHPELFRVVDVRSPDDRSGHRWCVDVPEDYELVRRIYEELGRDDFTWREALAVVEAHPDWSELNRHISQKSVPAMTPGDGLPLFLRADGGSTIGIGHAMRLLALGEAWVEHGGSATWLVADAPAGVIDRATAAGIAVERVAPGRARSTTRRISSPHWSRTPPLAPSWMVRHSMSRSSTPSGRSPTGSSSSTTWPASPATRSRSSSTRTPTPIGPATPRTPGRCTCWASTT